MARSAMPAAWQPLAVALVVLLRLHRVGAQFRLPSINTDKITDSISKANPSKAAEALAKGSMGKVAEALRGNSTDMQKAAEALRDAGKKKVQEAKGALEDIKDAANVSGQTGKIAQVIRSAAGTLHQGAEAINRTSKDDVAEGVSTAFQKVQAAAGKAVSEASEKADPQELAGMLHGNAPKVATVLNRTGLQVAGAIQKGAPLAAEAIKRAGEKKEPPSEVPTASQVIEQAVQTSDTWGPILAVAGVFSLSACGWFGYRRLSPQSSARAPNGLLADSDLGVQMRGARGLQRGESSEEACFTQF